MSRIWDNMLEANIFQNRLLRIHLKCMRWYGFITSENQKCVFWHKIRSFFFTLCFMCVSFLLFLRFSYGFGKLENGATGYATALIYCTSMVACINATIQIRRVLNLIKFVHEDLEYLFSVTDEEERACLDRAVRYVHSVTMTILIICITATIMLVLDWFFKSYFTSDMVYYMSKAGFIMARIRNGASQPVLMFQVYPYHEVYNNYIVNSLEGLLSIYFGATILPIWHTFIMALMKYIIFKQEILMKRIEKMDITKLSMFKGRTNFRDAQNLSQNELNYWRLQLCKFIAKEQVKTRWFVSELEILNRIPVFIDFVVFSIMICFLLYALVTVKPNHVNYIFMFVYFAGVISFLWIYHWHGTLLSESNDALRYAIYSCEWYNYSLEVQKTIHFLMVGTVSPLVMRAVLVQLNLRTFIDVVRGAYSYFSILWKTIHKTDA